MRVGTQGPPPHALLTRIWPACRPKLAFHSNPARQGSRPPWTERTTWQPPDQRGAPALCRAVPRKPRRPKSAGGQGLAVQASLRLHQMHRAIGQRAVMPLSGAL